LTTFLIRRLGFAFVTLFAVLTLVFVLVRIVPGDPAQLILGDQASREAIDALRTRLGLDMPISEQYVVFLKNALRGEDPMQAFEMTDDERYLDEALVAIRSLRGKGFELTYQTNNVAFGMLAALKLYQRIGDPELLGVSQVLCACLFDNVGLWSTRYGHARDRASFFGVFPMPTAPYTAAYEQAEVSAVCLEYIMRAGDELPGPMQILLPELIRHVTARLNAYYPPCIAQDALTDSPKTGHLVPDLWIPVEDLADGWDPAGTVGQEVYGAGIAFSTVARSYIRVPASSAQVYCEYPYRVLHADRRTVTLDIYGDPRLACRLRLIPDGGWSGDERVDGSCTGRLEPIDEDRRWRDYTVPAGQDVTVTWLD